MAAGNFIGTAADGASPLPNGGQGVHIVTSTGNVVGGLGIGNLIAFNALNGVLVDSTATGATIQENSIHDNANLGIDLGNDGVSLNDSDDPDVGANNLQNFPVITSAVSIGANTTISGTLNSVASSNFTLEFFANAIADGSGFGEGETFLGSTSVLTNGSGDATFTVTFPVVVPVGEFVVGTATDTAGNTSEFSGTAAVIVAEVEFTSANYTDSEGAATSTVVTLERTDDSVVSEVLVTITGGTASGGNVDYDDAAFPLTVTFNVGELVKNVAVPIVQESLVEPDETIAFVVTATIATDKLASEGLHEVLHRHWACEMPVYDAFLQEHAPADDLVYAMTEAIVAADVDCVGELLVRAPGLANAKQNDSDQTPMLYLAMESGNPILVKLLLSHGANMRITTRSGWTVLARACSHGTPQIVDLLLEHGADLDMRDCWGTLPIYGAVAMRNTEMVKHLITCGAKPDLKTAIDLNQLEVARYLLEQDSSLVTMRFGTGLTLLHDSAQVGDARLEASCLLLDFDAPINAVTNWGATPLHLAAFHGNVQTIELLMSHGADVGIKDKRGCTPLAIAQGRGNSKSAALIASKGDDVTHDEEIQVQESVGRTPHVDDVFLAYRGGGDIDGHPLDELDLGFGVWFREDN